MIDTRKILTAIALLSVVLISGCGHIARESFYRVTIRDRPDALREYTTWPRNLRFSPAEGVLLDISVGGGLLTAPPVDMSMRLKNGTTFKWTSRQFEWLDSEGATVSTGEIASMTFTNYCKPAPDRECSITDTSLSDGPVVTRESSWGKGTMIVYTVEPTSLLRGAELRKITSTLLLGRDKWLEVTSSLRAGGTQSVQRTGHLLKLPDAQINGQTVPMPIIDIQWVTKDVFVPATPIND